MTGRWLTVWRLVSLAALLAGCGATTKVADDDDTTATSLRDGCRRPLRGVRRLYELRRELAEGLQQDRAVRQSSPIRMVSACCGPVTKAGRHHCFLKVTLIGTKTLGCETVDLGPDGTPATIGRHENCALHK